MINYTPANIKLWSKLGARSVYGSIAAPEMLEQNNKIIFVVADVAASAGLGRLTESWPDNLLNVGIAEQNMIGVSAGLASEGFIPFASSFAPFVTARAADQIRMSMAYMRLPVKLVALASGLAMGINGPSHLGFEDAAIIHSMPGVAIVTPADGLSTIKAALAAATWDGPLYLRLTGVTNMPVIYEQDFDFVIGKAIKLEEGSDVLIIASGAILHNCLLAAKKLRENGVSAGVMDMHTLRPLDTGALDEALGAKLFVTVEEHSRDGSLGYAIAAYLADKSDRPPLLRVGLTNYPHADTYAGLIESAGLSPDGIAAQIKEKLSGLSR
ncbi:MAG: hypothetical protein K2H64_07080 [Desulfovibrio sp.]|nr:hypothetical protein [Desulfovibrio sp.]